METVLREVKPRSQWHSGWERRGRPRPVGPAGEGDIWVGPSSHTFFTFPFTKMEKEVSDFIQDSGQIKKKFQPMNKIERSIL